MTTFRFVAIASSILLAASAIPASAHSTADKISVKVYPSELATAEGRAAAIDRIERAAANACHVGDTMVGHLQQAQCQKRVTGHMLRQINSPELFAQWQGAATVRTASRN